MPFPGNTFYRSELEHSVLKEMDEHNAVLNGFLSMEHGPDGSHTNITAESITAGLITGNVIANYLRLNPSKVYTLRAPTDPLAFVTDGSDPDVSLWYANSTADVTVNGIYVSDLIRGVPGHMQLIVNNSAFSHVYQSAGVTNATRLYGCVTTVTVPPGGVIWFVYDGLNLGWRYVGSSVGGSGGSPTLPPFIAYTNVANTFGPWQTFITGVRVGHGTWTPSPAYPGIYVEYPDNASQIALRSTGPCEIAMTAHPAGGFIDTRTAHPIVFRVNGVQALSLNTNKTIQMNVVTNTGTVTITDGVAPSLIQGWLGGLYIQNNQYTSLNLKGASYGVEGGCFTYTDTFFMGSWSNHPVNIRTNNADRMTIAADGSVTVMGGFVVNSNIGCAGFIGCNQPFIYVGGFRVDVTANCSIPGTGGGAALPPNLAYLNLEQHWTLRQHFDGGLSWAGTDLAVYLNQSVRMDSSPTFANATIDGKLFSNFFDQAVRSDSSPTFNTPTVNKLTVNGLTQPDSVAIAADGDIRSTRSIFAGNFFSAQNRTGLTTTLVIGGVTRTFTGGLLTG